MTRLVALLVLGVFAAPAWGAPTLSMPPTASRTTEESRSVDSYPLPIGPWKDGRIETLLTEGEVTRSAWRIRQPGIETLAVLSGLRDQLRSEGFEILYECETDTCGGFDFRFSIPVLPEPDMHVDLGDFRFLAARRTGGSAPDYVSLLVSRSADSGYVQMWRVGAALADSVKLASSSNATPDTMPASESDLSKSLAQFGKVVLSDLSFDTGSTALRLGNYGSLALLAGYLEANPAVSIALVGHTDADGSLDANIALSRKRAQSVLKQLADTYGVDPVRMTADGVGYLSPMASNLTADGRAKNRRVEVMITSTR